MAGVKGRSGRKRKPIAQHLLNNTYRPDRHGPLPEGGRAAVLRLATVGGAALELPPVSTPVSVEPPAAVLEGLGPDGTALVRGILSEFELSHGELAVLRAAAEGRDRAVAARALIAVDGIVLNGRGGKYTHPAVRIEKAATAQELAALRQLGLPAPTERMDPHATT